MHSSAVNCSRTPGRCPTLQPEEVSPSRSRRLQATGMDFLDLYRCIRRLAIGGGDIHPNSRDFECAGSAGDVQAIVSVGRLLRLDIAHGIQDANTSGSEKGTLQRCSCMDTISGGLRFRTRRWTGRRSGEGDSLPPVAADAGSATAAKRAALERSKSASPTSCPFTVSDSTSPSSRMHGRPGYPARRLRPGCPASAGRSHPCSSR